MYQRIKTIRSTLKLSQKAFGERLGVSRDVISNLEGNRVQPRDTILRHICDVFHINEEWLRTGNGIIFMPTQPAPDSSSEPLSIFNQLTPTFQDYALHQMKQLLELQEKEQKQEEE